MRFKLSNLAPACLMFAWLIMTSTSADATSADAPPTVDPPSARPGTTVTVNGLLAAGGDPILVFFSSDGQGAAVPNARFTTPGSASGPLGPAQSNVTSAEVWYGRSLALPDRMISGQNLSYVFRDAYWFKGSEREAMTGELYISASSSLTTSGSLGPEQNVVIEAPMVPDLLLQTIRVDVIIDGQGGNGQKPPSTTGGPTGGQQLNGGFFYLDIVPSSWAASSQSPTSQDVVTDVALAINQGFGPMGWAAQVIGTELWISVNGGTLQQGFINIQLIP